LKNDPQIQILQAAMAQKISQLAKKYGLEVVVKVWEEVKMVDRDRAFYSLFGWKSEMTLREALEGLDDYCDFLEAMIWKRQERERGKSHYPPALFQ